MKSIKKCLRTHTRLKTICSYVFVAINIFPTLYLINPFKYFPITTYHFWSVASIQIIVKNLIICFGIFLLIAYKIIPFLRNQIKIQSIHNKWSWLKILFFLNYFILTLYFLCLIFQLNGNISFADSILALLTFGMYLFYSINTLMLRPNSSTLRKQFQFAEGAVGVDELGFEETIKSINNYFEANQYETSNPIRVVTVEGEQGSGKSSFARMLIESLNPTTKFLYTYISLTETNESKDFSVLFNDRWNQTIAERYPLLLSRMNKSVLRNIIHDINILPLKSLFNIFSSITGGIKKTKSKFHDQALGHKNDYVRNEVAQLFNHIPEFVEDHWIIMLDEIERSPLKEIYRVIEIIERFKLISRHGFPIAITFLICIDSNELKKTLSESYNKEISNLINSFFIDGGSKSISRRLFLPPTDYDIKNEFITKRVHKTITDLKLDEDRYCLKFNDVTESHQEVTHFLDNKESASYIRFQLLKSSPRIINRCFDEVENFYRSYRNRLYGTPAKDNIRFTDALCLSYIKIKCPIIIDFFLKTNSMFVYDDANMFVAFKRIISKIKEINEKNKKDNINEDRDKSPIIEYIKHTMGQEIPINEKEIESLIFAVAFHYNSNNSLYDDPWIDERMRSTSVPINLHNYLKTLGEDTNYKLYRLFSKHKNEQNQKCLKNVDDNFLLAYEHEILSQTKDSKYN